MRRGVTLIEVVAALTLLALLLAAALRGYGKNHHQLRLAEQRIEAAQAADELLTTWLAARDSVPRNAQGAVPGSGRLMWRTLVLQRTRMDVLPVEIVRLEVFSPTASPHRVLTQVDLLLPFVPRPM